MLITPADVHCSWSRVKCPVADHALQPTTLYIETLVTGIVNKKNTICYSSPPGFTRRAGRPNNDGWVLYNNKTFSGSTAPNCGISYFSLCQKIHRQRFRSQLLFKALGCRNLFDIWNVHQVSRRRRDVWQIAKRISNRTPTRNRIPNSRPGRPHSRPGRPLEPSGRLLGACKFMNCWKFTGHKPVCE